MSVIESERLRLRRFTAADAGMVLALLTDPDFLANVGERGVRDLAQAEVYLQEGPLASYERFGFGLYAVELKDSGQGIGMCGLLHRDTHEDVEIGFALVPQARRQGYAREAAQATLRYATGALGLRRVVALTAPRNAASIRILTFLGFRFERMAQLSPGGSSRLFVYTANPS